MGRFLAILGVVVVGCSGQIGDPALQTPDPEPPAPADSPSPTETPVADSPPDPWASLRPGEPPPMRRLTNTEIEAAMTALMGEEIGFTDGFPPEERQGGFENNASVLTFPPTLSERAFEAAERAGQRVASNPGAFADCAESTRNAACASTLIGAFARRAWRRPVEPDELARLMSAYELGAEQEGFELGVSLAVQATLLSLPFYYLVEDGTAIAKPGWLALDGYQRASRLAFFLWRAPPDEALLAAAADGRLDTTEGVVAQAERMLDAPRALDALEEFHRQWLELDRVAQVNKDPERYPDWDDELPSKMLSELELFVREASYVDDSVEALLTARYSFQDEVLRRFYADGSSPEATGFDRLQLPPRRAGLLARGGFLIMEGFDQTSPVLRGLFIREKMLCGELPPPPEFVDNVPSEPSDNDTTRSRVEAHASDPQCRGCHQFMDPIGFGLERYDATGQWRTTEAGLPIDDRGEVVATDLGTFQGAAELGADLAGSAFFRACFVRKWFRFALGRLETDQDLSTLRALFDVVATTGSYRALRLALVQTDQFLYRRTEDSQ